MMRHRGKAQGKLKYLLTALAPEETGTNGAKYRGADGSDQSTGVEDEVPNATPEPNLSRMSSAWGLYTVWPLGGVYARRAHGQALTRAKSRSSVKLEGR